MTITRKDGLALLGIIIIGVILRIFQLGYQCYWLEEIYTLNLVNNPINDVIYLSLFKDCNPPIYYVLAHLSSVLWGFQDVAIRYPSIVCGILLIPAMYFLGREFKNGMTGLYCAGITAVLYPLVYYSQFGRAYATVFLFFVITLIFYLKLWNERFTVNLNTQIYFSVMAAITVWAHLFAIIPVGLMICFYFKEDLIKAITSSILFIFLITPMYPIIYGTQERGSGYGMDLLKILVITPTEFFSWIFPYIGGLFCIGVYQERQKSITVSLIVITGVTIISGLIASIFTPVFPRYFMTVSFIITLFTACACENGLSALKWSDNAKITLLFCLMAIVLVIQSPEYLTHYFVQKYQC